MKEQPIDNLFVGDRVALHLPGYPAIRGTYTGLIMEHATREWFMEVVTAEGEPLTISTRGRPVIYRTRRAPQDVSDRAARDWGESA